MNSLIKATWTNALSRAFGKFAAHEFPFPVQVAINWLYVKSMGVDLRTFAPLDEYPSLNALFTRKLLYPRELPKDPKAIVSPSDATITACGAVKEGLLLQIKGFYYQVDELLTPHIDAEERKMLHHGRFINLYLSPKDYHRYHVPMDMRVTKVVHVPGLLYPVNFRFLLRVPELFIKNERLILECYDSNNDLFFMVLVGALNVGKMTLSFDRRIETNTQTEQVQIYTYDNVTLKKGEELGVFMMGSTIVMLFEEGMVDLVCRERKRVRFGEIIANKRAN